MYVGDPIELVVGKLRLAGRLVRILDRRGLEVRRVDLDAPEPYTLVVVDLLDGRRVSVPLWVDDFPIRLVSSLAA